MGSLPRVREPGQGEADGFRQMGGTWDSLGKRGRTWVLSGCKCLVSMWPSGCPWMSGCLWVSGHQRGCGCQGASVAMRASVAMGVGVSGCQRGHGCQGAGVAVSASVPMGASVAVGVGDVSLARFLHLSFLPGSCGFLSRRAHLCHDLCPLPAPPRELQGSTSSRGGV